MANNRNPIEKLPKMIFTGAMPQAGIPSSQVTNIMGKLSMTCKHFNKLFKEAIPARRLCQAVIDDDREIVKQLLGNHPELLLLEPKNMVIESKHTFQRFYAENPLTMAVKRKQIEMIELMLPYYDNIKDKQTALKSKEKSLSAWANDNIFEINILETNEDVFEIEIPEKYTTYMQSIIDVIKEEMGDYQNLNEKTEKKLTQLFNDLLPEKPMKLDDYFDVELLLLAAYQAYRDNFDTFETWNQRDTFAIRVIGLILTMQSPELAKIFCDGLTNQVNVIQKGEKKDVGKDSLAAHLKLKGGEAFYRVSRDSHAGAGFNFFCGIYGAARTAGFWCREWKLPLSGTRRFSILMSSKSIKFSKLMQPHQKEQSRCVIF